MIDHDPVWFSKCAQADVVIDGLRALIAELADRLDHAYGRDPTILYYPADLLARARARGASLGERPGWINEP